MSSNLGLGWANRQLDVASLNFSTAREIEVAQTISVEVERLRSLVRSEFPPTPGNGGLLGLPYDYASSLPWEDLIASNVSSVLVCAEKLGLQPKTVVRFAREKCRPSNYLPLFWVEQYLALLDEKLSADMAHAIDKKAAKAMSFRDVGAKGGKKSGEVRKKNARSPSVDQLIAERDKLIAAGTPEKGIISALSKKFDLVGQRQLRRVLASARK